MLTIRIDDTEVKKKLDILKTGVKNFKKPLKVIGNKFLKIYSEDVFRTQGGAIGDKWKKLSPATLLMRRKRVGYYAQTPKTTSKKLVWTGKLQGGFNKTVTKTRLVINNTVDYFKYHQRSTGRPPQRKMLGLTKKIVTIVIEEFNKYIKNLIKK